MTDGPFIFATRGAPCSDDDHLVNVLQPAFNTLGARHETVARLMQTGTWDPEEKGCIAAFNELVGTLDAAINFVTELRETMPPLEWRAVHRELTRAVAQQVCGQVFIAMTIVAADTDTASRLRDDGNRSFATGARHAERIAALIDLILHSPSDGPFQADGSLDVAALAWASVGEQSTSIANGAGIVRGAFVDVPGMATLPDQYAVLLLPLLASGARVVDYGILVDRAKKLRSVLDVADASTAWLVDPTLLVSRVQDGVERITAETERLGREWRYGLPRFHIMNSLAEIYRQLVEGALRELGGILLVAARAGRSGDYGTYEREVIDGIKAGEVVNELEQMGAPLSGAVDMLYRNASAHADIVVTDSGIIATKRVIRDSREVSRTTTALSDAEFSEEMVALQEILLALQLTILPWIWAHGDQRVGAAVVSMRPTALQITRTLALLGGMTGLNGVAVSREGNQITIAADRFQDNSSRRDAGILSLVPAAFGAVPEATEVTLDISELHSVTFTHAEFAALESDETPHGLTMLGFTTAKWLIESGASWTEQDEATYVTFPLTMLYFACMRFAGSEPQNTENIDRAIEFLEIARSRLDDIVVSGRRSPLTRQAVRQIDILATAFTGLAESKRDQRQTHKALGLAQKANATISVMYQIQEEAKALRDARPQ
ncbi:hypothetical protein [Amycolatopsis sp.]|uniref:hypothetical protein n=1 Tax=Amycolatopsis sp. TaxID=37632 RepID=UPI0026077E4F|nr:hypothetical protein [Amycolatopsis sp.]